MACGALRQRLERGSLEELRALAQNFTAQGKAVFLGTLAAAAVRAAGDVGGFRRGCGTDLEGGAAGCRRPRAAGQRGWRREAFRMPRRWRRFWRRSVRLRAARRASLATFSSWRALGWRRVSAASRSALADSVSWTPSAISGSPPSYCATMFHLPVDEDQQGMCMIFMGECCV